MVGETCTMQGTAGKPVLQSLGPAWLWTWSPQPVHTCHHGQPSPEGSHAKGSHTAYTAFCRGQGQDPTGNRGGTAAQLCCYWCAEMREKPAVPEQSELFWQEETGRQILTLR